MDRDLLAENKRLKENNILLHEFIESNRTTYLKAEIEQLQAENENWKARYIEAVNDMAALKRKVVKLEHALKGE